MSNANVGKVFNMTGGNGGGGTLKLETLTITKQPNKTVYKSGESFDPTGMIVTAGYGYGLTSDVTGYSVSPQILTDGVTEVTITYTEGRVTKTAMVSVTVEKVLVSSTRSARLRTGSSMARSRATASSMEQPSPHRGWLRRVSL